MGGVCARGSAMPGVCRLGVASLRRMSRWSGSMLEVGCRWEAYVGSGWPMRGDGRRMSKWSGVPMPGVCRKWSGDGRRMLGVCWKWRDDARRMSRVVVADAEAYVEVDGRWEAYVGSGDGRRCGGVCMSRWSGDL